MFILVRCAPLLENGQKGSVAHQNRSELRTLVLGYQHKYCQHEKFHRAQLSLIAHN